MIDTDKYKGHTPAPWELSPDDWVWAEHLFMQGNTTNFGNAMLITDAPLLLAEVKRLRRVLEDIESMIPDNHEEVSPVLSDILSECHRVLPMFNEVIE